MKLTETSSNAEICIGDTVILGEPNGVNPEVRLVGLLMTAENTMEALVSLDLGHIKGIDKSYFNVPLTAVNLVMED